MLRFIENEKVDELLNLENEKWTLTVNRYSDAKDRASISDGKGHVYSVRMAIANKIAKQGKAEVLHSNRYM